MARCPSFFGPCLTQRKLLELRERERGRITIHPTVDLSITILSTNFNVTFDPYDFKFRLNYLC